MKAENNGSNYRVTVTNEELYAFAKTWPAHNLDLDAEYRFEFSTETGDLVAMEKYIDGKLASMDDAEDGPDFVALAEEACEMGARELGHESVLAIRYGESAGPKL